MSNQLPIHIYIHSSKCYWRKRTTPPILLFPWLALFSLLQEVVWNLYSPLNLIPNTPPQPPADDHFLLQGTEDTTGTHTLKFLLPNWHMVFCVQIHLISIFFPTKWKLSLSSNLIPFSSTLLDSLFPTPPPRRVVFSTSPSKPLHFHSHLNRPNSLSS